MKRTYMKYICALILFGSNGLVSHGIGLPTHMIVLVRTLIGSLLLWAILFLQKNKLNFIRYRRDCFFLALSGVAMGVSWLFLYRAYSLIGVSVASLCYYCGPVFVMALSPWILKEKSSGAKLVCFAVVLAGIVLVNGSLFGTPANKTGVCFGLLAALSYSALVICNKKNEKIRGLESAAVQVFASFLTVFTVALTKQNCELFPAPSDWCSLIFLGVFNTGIACYLYFSSIDKLPVQTVSIFGYIEPLSAVLLSVLFLKEKMAPLQILGAVMIVGGAAASELKLARDQE